MALAKTRIAPGVPTAPKPLVNNADPSMTGGVYGAPKPAASLIRTAPFQLGTGMPNMGRMNNRLAAQEGGDASIAPTDSFSGALANRAEYLSSHGLTAHDANDPSITHPSNMPTGIVNGNQVYDTKPTLYATGNGVTYFNPTNTPTQVSASSTHDDFVLGANLAGGTGYGNATPQAGGGVRGATGTGAGGGAYGGLPGYNFGGNTGASGQLGTNAQNDLNAANAANNARYNQALGVNANGQQSQQIALDANYGNIYNAISANQSAELAALASAGTTAHAQEDRRLSSAQGKTASGLAGRGLYNSTILDSEERGNATDSALVQNQISESADQQRLGVYTANGQQMVGALGDYAHAETSAQQYGQSQLENILESKTDQGPNTGQLFNLLSQPGALSGAAQQATGSNDPNVLLAWIQQQLAKMNGGAGPSPVAPAGGGAKYGSGAVVPNNAGFGTGGTGGGGFGGGYDAGHADPNLPPLTPAADGEMTTRQNPSTGVTEYWDPYYQQWLPQG